MKALNNKILVELLEPSLQPKKTVISPNGDALKKAKVISVGKDVEQVTVDDIVVCYVNDFIFVKDNTFMCTERNILFIDTLPLKGKVHIIPLEYDTLNMLRKAKVVASNDGETSKEDVILFKVGQGVILPDQSEIISSANVFAKV